MMKILSKNRTTMVNMDRIEALTIYKTTIGLIKREQEETPYRILAWSGVSEEECYALGNYESMNRCKEIIRDIWKVSDIKHLYEMPEV